MTTTGTLVVLAGGAAVALYVLHQVGHHLARVLEALATVAVVFVAVWFLIKGAYIAAGWMVRHWRTTLQLPSRHPGRGAGIGGEKSRRSSRHTARVTTETPTGGTIEARDPVAELVACGRCGTLHLLVIAERCADCIALLGLEGGEAYTAWRREVTALVERGPGTR